MGIAGAFTLLEKGDSKFSLIYNLHTSILREIIKHIPYIMYLHPLREVEKKDWHYLPPLLREYEIKNVSLNSLNDIYFIWVYI